MFGMNSASYKFALAKALLNLSKNDSDFITLEELAAPFSEEIVTHLKSGYKQTTSRSSKFLEACRSFANGDSTQTQLIDETVRRGFVNVIDAFHIVNSDEIPQRFFVDERTGPRKGIRITDNFRKLTQSECKESLKPETEARWRLVETAWELNLATQLIDVQHDLEDDALYVPNRDRRVNVTSSRDALNGYQKGRCFYCFRDISITPGNPDLAEVDHFFPHVLKRDLEGCNLDGVWNLVLACSPCNGPEGKWSKLPTIELLERLHQRNEYLIGSNHPLKDTIIRQTGAKTPARETFLQRVYSSALERLIHTWQAQPQAPATF